MFCLGTNLWILLILKKYKFCPIYVGTQGVLQFVGLQRVGHNWATELNWGHSIKHVLNTYMWLVSLLGTGKLLSVLLHVRPLLGIEDTQESEMQIVQDTLFHIKLQIRK